MGNRISKKTGLTSDKVVPEEYKNDLENNGGDETGSSQEHMLISYFKQRKEEAEQKLKDEEAKKLRDKEGACKENMDFIGEVGAGYDVPDGTIT